MAKARKQSKGGSPLTPSGAERQPLDIRELLKEFGSYTAAVLGIGYVSGFIVFHTYLGSLGVVPFGVLSVQYLVSGILFVSAVAIVWVPAWIGEMIARSMLTESKQKEESAALSFWTSFMGRVIGAAGGWFLGGLVLYWIGVKTDDIVWWIPLAYIPHVLLRFRYLWTAWVEAASPFARFALFHFPLFVIFLVGLSGIFGANIYPQIDRALGGGNPVRLELEIDREGQEITRGVYDILAVTEQHWVVRDTAAAAAYYIIFSDRVKVATLRGDAISPFGKRFRRER